jgi:hypothetical protein
MNLSAEEITTIIIAAVNDPKNALIDDPKFGQFISRPFIHPTIALKIAEAIIAAESRESTTK